MLHRVFKLLTLLTMHCLHCYTAWTAFTATVHAHWHLYICCYGSGALRTSASLNNFGRSDIIISRNINVIIFAIIINQVIIIIIINIIIIPQWRASLFTLSLNPGRSPAHFSSAGQPEPPPRPHYLTAPASSSSSVFSAKLSLSLSTLPKAVSL